MNKTQIYSELSKFVKKTDFWIGLITMLLIVGVVVNVTLAQVKKQRLVAQKEKIISPVTMIVSPTPTVVPIAQTIKKLAYTGRDIAVVVQPGDTFWSISEYVCGDGKYFESIQLSNGYRYQQLHAGDVINVTCE
ncbi:MAG: LysM peptidoglycan-binding domain-containing protein [bacterium]|nr:LysM peptidoglycan-binding domain-containing protein [bacterium]